MAHIVIGDFGLAFDLAISVIRNTNAARLRDPSQTRSDIDPLTEDVVVVDDDVADMNADTKLDPLAIGHIDIAACHFTLYFDRAAHRVDGACKLHQHAIAGGLDDA